MHWLSDQRGAQNIGKTLPVLNVEDARTLLDSGMSQGLRFRTLKFRAIKKHVF